MQWNVTKSSCKDCGKKLNVPQLTINTAIVFMHRFFMLHSFKVKIISTRIRNPWLDCVQRYDKYDIGAASLFLAAKVEENPRKVEHVLKTREEWRIQMERERDPGRERTTADLDVNSEDYQRKLNRLVDHEVSTTRNYHATYTD